MDIHRILSFLSAGILCARKNESYINGLTAPKRDCNRNAANKYNKMQLFPNLNAALTFYTYFRGRLIKVGKTHEYDNKVIE